MREEMEWVTSRYAIRVPRMVKQTAERFYEGELVDPWLLRGVL